MPEPHYSPAIACPEATSIVRTRVGRRLLRWPGRTIDGMGADDLCQEVMLVLLTRETLSKFNPHKGTYAAFVAMCADRIVVEFERKALNRERLVPRPLHIDEVAPVHSQVPSPESLVFGNDLERRLRVHLQSTLSLEEWLLYQRIYDDEMPKEVVMKLEGIDSGRFYRFRHKVKAIARAFIEGDS